MVENQAQKSIQQRQINLFVDFRQHRFHQHIAFAFTSFPNVRQVIDALTPLQEQSESHGEHHLPKNEPYKPEEEAVPYPLQKHELTVRR